MMQRIERQEQLFSRYVPREDPIQRQAQQAFQGAIEEEEYPSAVKALDVYPAHA
ncbi:hypothetical protein [Salinibacter ruber]|uniref:Uncharacterized protein n=1 Tax=Salinibacter ruber TaxID=146919 RepID=A0A9X2V9E9_9BACT|nr:hypothetical protein [Salinibacter ruber]MCS4039921.1 hypothetical protein [Salinibacter ruber]MCS4123063.1 hypothetical protein [Salinibacter ruber]MCS4223880.1 hypothetical protein [Salinibacter ruber]